MISIPTHARTSSEILGSSNVQIHARFVGDHLCRELHCFGPLVTNFSQGKVSKFTGVSFDKGVATGYNQNFPNGTSVARALRLMRKYLPSDTKFSLVIKMYSRGGNWGQGTGTSRTLGKSLARTDPQGKFCLFFGGWHLNQNSTYQSTDVQGVSISSWIVGVYEGC